MALVVILYSGARFNEKFSKFAFHFSGVVAVSREERRAGKDLEDFELIKAEGIEYGQLIIRSLRTKKFVRIEHNTLHADESDELDASKFVLKSRYLFCFHLTVGDRTLGERPEIMNTLCLAFSRLPLPHNASVTQSLEG